MKIITIFPKIITIFPNFEIGLVNEFNETRIRAGIPYSAFASAYHDYTMDSGIRKSVDLLLENEK